MDSPRAQITGLVVTYNDAEFLPRCLGSLTFCDELLVVDVGSNDASTQIAREYGARVIEMEHVPFAEKVHARAAALAKHEWVLLADPDMEYPEWMAERLPRMLAQYEDQGLAMVILPMITYSEHGPFNYGRKGGVRGRAAVFHRHRVEIPGYLHYRGFEAKEGFLTLGLVSPPIDGVRHYSYHGLGDLIRKSERYLRYEAESRHGIGQRFSWQGMWLEIYRKLADDVRKQAYRSPTTLLLMIYQVVNIIRANFSLKRYERQLTSDSSPEDA